MRVVLDTNVLLSAIIKANSVPAAAVRLISVKHVLLTSSETQQELYRVLSKPCFSTESILGNIKVIFSASDHIEIIETVTACRDPMDDKFLDLAINGRADIIISGDKDLLSMRLYKDTRIITPAEFIKTELI